MLFTETDDEEAYEGLGPYKKPLTGRDRPYGKGRSFTGMGPSQRRTTWSTAQ